MTENHRIFINVLATYGRTLVGVACGIFSTRWVLMALGHEDFGLYGVVGSLAIFVTFLNTQFSSAISRFYAFAIGQGRTINDNGLVLEECRKWFSTAVMIHTLLPIALVSVGYVLGVKAITGGYLVIPGEKVDTCVWLWRFMMISCFIGMVNVPFAAMYAAKQYIAEVTIYSVVQLVAKTIFIYYMSITPREWLKTYGLAMCIIAIVPQLLICWRAVSVFPECRLRCVALFDLHRIRKLSSYAWWQMFAGIGFLARHQFLEVIVNKFYGPTVNAAYTVGATVGGEAAALTGALNVAFSPALATKFGENAINTMRAMAYRSCKLGTFFTLIFAIPMLLEIDELLLLWLKDPPRHAATFCVGWLCAVAIEKFTLGHCQAVNASGNVSRFLFVRGLACITAIPLTILAAVVSGKVTVFCLAFVAAALINCVTDVLFARRVTGLSIGYWFTEIMVPLGFASIVSFLVGFTVVLMLPQSLLRICATTALVEIVMLGMAWLVVLDRDEKEYLLVRVKRIVAKNKCVC